MYPPRRENSGALRHALALGGALLAAMIAMPAAAQTKPGTPQQRQPQSPDAEQTYERCMSLAQTHPEQAFAQAMQWRNHGGGFAAEHCEAVSLYGLQQYDEAATRFHEIAHGITGDTTSLRVDAYDQAAQAWIMAQKPQNARAEFDAALKLQPKDIHLLIGRAEAAGLARDYWGALDDLNAVLEIDRKSVEALVLRAAAYRHVDAIDLAADDANRAVALSPQFADAYLERGAVSAAKGDYPGARKDWGRVLELVPNTYTAQQAQNNLAELDKVLGPTKPSKAAAPPPKN